MTNKILLNIPKILRNNIGIQKNGYFESKENIDKNAKIYEKISDRAINISNILDKNILIDNEFDNIMEDFKKEFINVLNYIEKSKKEKFPLKNNMFLNSNFIINSFKEMDENFKEEEVDILKYIKNENL